jgi:hypothetical protein
VKKISFSCLATMPSTAFLPTYNHSLVCWHHAGRLYTTLRYISALVDIVYGSTVCHPNMAERAWAHGTSEVN